MMNLRVENLSLSFAERSLFKELSFSFEKQKVYRLLGASGVGKSTFLRCLNRVQIVDEGLSFLEGGEGLSMMEFRSKVLYFPQQAKISLPTVREELLYPFSLKLYQGESLPSDDLLNELLAKLGLAYLKLSQSTVAMSPGEQQRLSFLRLFLLHPDYLLLDEPFSAVDEANAKQMWDLLLAEQEKKGFSVIFIQHQSYSWMKADNYVELKLLNGKLLVEDRDK